MAGAKRKADSGTGSDAQKAKRSRASAVSATAAVDRPRRSRGGDSAVKPTPAAETASASTAKKSAAAKTKAKTETTKATKKNAPAAKKEKSTPVKKEPADSAEGKKLAAASKAQKRTAEPKKKEDQGETKNSAAAKKKGPAEAEERAPGEIRYWLMKAEPESRIEKGVDVKFSIHDLESRTKPEPWDGVRNPMAQKNMRSMKKGDLAFFYHSNCKIPGIAGLMQIVREHSIDESAFDEKHPYFDPKSSRDKPRWRVVHVEHLRTLDELVPLRELQKHAKEGGALAGMQVLRMSRLSVSQVSAKEWEYILCELVGINPKEIKAK